MADISKMQLIGEATPRNIKDRFARTAQYAVTLNASNWVQDNSNYTYTLSLSSLTCGSDGSVSPIISCTSNQEEYSKIISAMATPGVGIVFTANEQPSNAINISIQDIH